MTDTPVEPDKADAPAPLIEVIVDCMTGEQTIRELSPEEVAEREALTLELAKEQAAREAEAAEREAKRQAVLAALAGAAGLSVDEVREVLA